MQTISDKITGTSLNGPGLCFANTFQFCALIVGKSLDIQSVQNTLDVLISLFLLLQMFPCTIQKALSWSDFFNIR